MKHAIISDHNDCYRIETDGFVHLEHALTVQKIHQLMERIGIDVLWAMPGCHFSQTIRREHFEILEGTHYSVYVPEHLVRNRVYGARVTYKLKGNYNEPAKDRFFMFPENREWKVPRGKDGGVWHVETPEDLLRIVQILEAEYGYCLWGPSYIGLHYFKDIMHRQNKTILGLSDYQRTEYDQISRNMVHPIAWANLHTHGKYLHWLDKNGWYLGGAQSVELGNGEYTKLEQPAMVDSRIPAFYRVDANLPQAPIFSWLPYPIPLGEIWVSNDLLTCAMKMGMNIRILECVYWLKYGKYLNQWAIDMWVNRAKYSQLSPHGVRDVRQGTIECNIYYTAKHIPNTMMGRLRNEGLAHWNDAIIHRAIANQLYTLQRLYRDEGVAPVMVSKDALFFASDEWDPYTALPSMLEYEHEQRGYKWVGTCELTDEIVYAFSRVHEKRFGVNGLEALIRRTMNHVVK